MKKLSLQHTLVWFLCSITLLGITACQSEITETPEPDVEITETAQVTEEINPIITLTPTKVLSGVIFVTSPEADLTSVSQIQDALNSLITEEESVLIIQEDLSQEMITPNVKVVVGVGPNLNLNNLASVTPEVTFVVIEDPTAFPSSNLSVIGDPVIERQSQVFMAGYLSALISEDYKVAALVPLNTADMDVLIESFMIGAEFFCGVCNPLHPPYNDFPYWQTLSSENASSGFEPAIDNLVNYGVEVIFIHDELASSELLSYVSSVGLKVISDGEPDMARNNWIGTVTVDLGEALVKLWPTLLSKSEGIQVDSKIRLINTDAELVSVGRKRLFDEMAADLQAGLISPYSDP